MPTLEQSIKKSIQSYYAGQDIHRDPNAVYTIKALDDFDKQLNGKDAGKKDDKKVGKGGKVAEVAPKGGNAVPVIPNALQGQLPMPLKPMKPPNKSSFMDAVQGLAGGPTPTKGDYQ